MEENYSLIARASKETPFRIVEYNQSLAHEWDKKTGLERYGEIKMSIKSYTGTIKSKLSGIRNKNH